MKMMRSQECAQRREARQATISTVVFLTVIVAIVALVSWVEYRLFDFAEPWVRIVGIAGAWVIAIWMFVHALRHPRATAARVVDHT